MSEYHAGRVQSVIFENDAQSFYVLDMLLDGQSSADAAVESGTTVRGNVPGLDVKPGAWFGFEGHWENHDKYGRQLVIDRAPVIKGSWDAETALKMLQSHGIGGRTCDSLHDHFGDDLLEVLGDSEKLQQVPGISQFAADHIVSRWHAVRSMFQSLEFLGELKLPKKRIEQIYAHFGDDAERLLSENPWALVQIDGINFDQADEVARKLSLDLASESRMRGAALYTCKARRGMGHLYLSSGELVKGITQYAPEVDKSKIARTLKDLHDEGLLVIDNKTRPGVTAIYEPWFNRLETESARLLAERIARAEISEQDTPDYLEKLATVGPKTEKAANRKGAKLKTVAKAAIKEFSEHGHLTLSDTQFEGAVHALTESVSILTGLPGTGKTTTLRVVVKVLQDAGVPFLLAAPTGIAAKRLAAVTGAEASTIHRAFGAKGKDRDDGREATYAGIVGFGSRDVDADGSQEYWGFSAHQPHPAKVAIIDESSMVDQHLLFRVLTCTAKDCRIVFVGDAAQLPSVGPGNVLRDLIDSERIPVTDLREIFRQDEASDIVIAAHAINRGEVPEFKRKSLDFSVIEVRDEGRIKDTITATVQKLYERKANFQVLSPRHAGTLGVTNLNLRIRELLNPKTPGLREMRLGSEMIREGDRVMVAKNNYRFEIFNGDVGKVIGLDPKTKIVEIKIHGPPVMHVQMPFKDAPSHLRMAYCTTVHKSQGQEYDVILMPWVTSFRHQLQRNLLYTAITRARKKVIIVGHPEALSKAIGNNKVDARNTLFPDRLREFLDQGKAAAKSG
jgi:exodeoxyribonuclease V alpha subunit